MTGTIATLEESSSCEQMNIATKINDSKPVKDSEHRLDKKDINLLINEKILLPTALFIDPADFSPGTEQIMSFPVT